jgi:putative ABC transport system ATP-binding protein
VSKLPIVEFEGVSKIYGSGDAEVRALDGVDLRIEKGEFVAIMGASGSGKSTAMNVIGCLDVPTFGTFRFHDVDTGALDQNQRALLRRHYIGFVFQGFNLLARTTALENVELPLAYRRVPARRRRERAMESLAAVGLADRAEHTPAELSGGQQQRVAIARALVSEPRLILADEPTGNLDTETSAEILALLRALNAKQGLTILVVTHDPDVARRTDRVLLVRDGRLVADGSPATVLAGSAA